MTRTARNLGAAGLLAVAASLAVACSSGQSQSPRAASTSPSRGQYAGVVLRVADIGVGDLFYLAEKDGTLQAAVKPYGAQIKIVGTFANMQPAVQAITAGAADLTSGSVTAAAGALAGNADIKIFASQPDEPAEEALIVKKNSPITSVRDLVGKTVAVNEAGTGQYMLLQALAYNHVPASEVHQVYLDPPQAGPAFTSGQVPVWSTFSSYVPIAVDQDGGRILVTGRQVGTANDLVYVASDSVASKYPLLLKAVYSALAAEAQKEIKNPSAEETVLESGLHLSPAESRFIATETTPVTADGAAQVTRFQRVADFFYKAGALPSAVNLAPDVIDVNDLG